jgi:hypothetical protein
MSTVPTQAPDRQAARAVDHPPKRSGRGGAEGLEPRVAGGLTLQTTHLTPGLVLSAKTVRVVPLTWGPGSDSVLAAARAFGPTQWSTSPLDEESPLPRLKIAPGVLQLTRTSIRQVAKATARARERRDITVKFAGQFLADNPDWRLKGLPARSVTEWSGKSRSNMVKTFASLDWSPIERQVDAGRNPAMVTLTWPADWETVAPDGKTAKRQVRAWKLRYGRAWRESIVALWKFEFQKRGAPHFHMYMCPPHGRAHGRGVGSGLSFTHWQSVVWADVVNHPDPVEYMKHLAAGTAVDFAEAMKCTDPKRLAIYFTKHGQYQDKEYQNRVPEAWQEPGRGPGRFWGYWGLKPLVAAVELRDDDYELAARILRRWSQRVQVWVCAGAKPCPRGQHRCGCYQKWVRAMQSAKASYWAVDYSTGEFVRRKHRRRARVRRFSVRCSGFLLVNDGPAMAIQLARAIEVCRK